MLIFLSRFLPLIRNGTRWPAALLTAMASNGSAAVTQPTSEAVEFFEQKIRPVLVAECYECHAQEKQKGGLRLDSREGWSKGGDTGPAIVPGNVEKSLLIRSLTHRDPDLKMPSKAPKLDDVVIADFVAWVKMGAPDPRTVPDAKDLTAANSWQETLATRRQRWCFQPVNDPPIPAVKNTAWSAHPIDRFLLEKIEVKGLAPAPDADPRVVLRRLSFALTGLPPSLAEQEAFVQAAAADRTKAVEAAASRMLASPAFGERWARHWMDLARYAETMGSEHDYLNPHAWQYRDYLIRAFNADLPYDRFVQEQIAGDLLEPRWNSELGINEALLGSAWHRMIESYASPVDVKREEISVVDWQIEALGKTFLGLTVQCARCHDHKFDPISDEDFYALYGVFASARPVLNILDRPEKLTAQDTALTQTKDELRRELANYWRASLQAPAVQAALQTGKDAPKTLRDLANAPNFAAAWKGLQAQDSSAKDQVILGDLAGWRVSGPGLPDRPSAPGLLSLRTGDAFVRAIQPAGFYSDAASERHGGSIRSPEFIIHHRAVSVLASGSGKARLRLVIENFQNDLLLFSGVNPDLESPAPKWYTMRIKEQWMGHRARVELMTRDDKTCVGEQGDQVAWAKTDGRSSFGVQKVVLHNDSTPTLPLPLPSAVRQANSKSWPELAGQITAEASAALTRWGRGAATDEDAGLLQMLLQAGALPNKPGMAAPIDALVGRFREIEAKVPHATRAPGVRDDGYSYDSAFFPRGDHTRPGPPVPRRFLEVLGGKPLGGTASGRLELARQLTRLDNPLTARVMVNRIWQHLTGRGIVPTVDNFGKMGEPPTHPELLDHLATKFMQDGWSVKRLVHYIVTSRAWQLSSTPVAGAAEVDPDNTLLASARPRRLEAEAIRDAMLAAAGNLVPGYSGPGIPPYYRNPIDPRQPKSGPITGNGRRSVYLETRRLFPAQFLSAFDMPKSTILMGQRSVTNVPGQSLALLNDPFVLHQAEVWAKRITAAESAENHRIERMYLEAFGRPPTADELGLAVSFINDRAENPWAALGHAMFNMKEFIYLP